ncbi:MAG: hypothetical protein H6729_11365 [Deltaproteobacteria bacterium]|nr:hypothetical protein [Deltaproteobacteria bacterium]
MPIDGVPNRGAVSLGVSKRALDARAPSHASQVEDADPEAPRLPSETEFSTHSWFTGWERKAAGEARLGSQVEAMLVERAQREGLPVRSAAELEALCKRANIDYESLYAQAEQECVTSAAPRTVLEQRALDAARGKTPRPSSTTEPQSPPEPHLPTESYVRLKRAYIRDLGQACVRDVVAASVLFRCIRSGLLEPSVRLDTPLPDSVLERVRADPRRRVVEGQTSASIQTYRDLLVSLERGSGRSARTMIDALELARYLPGCRQMQLFEALTQDVSQRELTAGLRSVGFHGYLDECASVEDALVFDAPSAYGMEGTSAFERLQQQCVSRLDALLVGKHEGPVRSADAVRRVNDCGDLETVSYASAAEKPVLRGLDIHAHIVEAIREYAALPTHRQMQWLDYDDATGDAAAERANPNAWQIDLSPSSIALGGIWKNQADVAPSQAILDATSGGGGAYTTECGRARAILRLRGLLNFYRDRYGADLGQHLFDARFASTASDRRALEKHLQQYRAALSVEPSLTWRAFCAQHPVPAVSCALRLARHDVVKEDGSVHEDLFDSGATPEGPGDRLYVSNPSATTRAVREGYVGENVVDLGFLHGKHEYFGHPDGIFDLAVWKKHLTGVGFSLRQAADVLEYAQPSAVIERISSTFTGSGLGSIADAFSRPMTLDASRASRLYLHAQAGAFGVEDWTVLLASMDDQAQRTIRTFLAKRGVVSTQAHGDEEMIAQGLQRALSADGTLPPSLRVALGTICGATTLRERAHLLKDAGCLSSKQALDTWRRGPRFEAELRPLTSDQYLTKTARTATVREILQAVLPGLDAMPTNSAIVNHRGETVADLLVSFLEQDAPMPPELVWYPG